MTFLNRYLGLYGCLLCRPATSSCADNAVVVSVEVHDERTPRVEVLSYCTVHKALGELLLPGDDGRR